MVKAAAPDMAATATSKIYAVRLKAAVMNGLGHRPDCAVVVPT